MALSTDQLADGFFVSDQESSWTRRGNNCNSNDSQSDLECVLSALDGDDNSGSEQGDDEELQSSYTYLDFSTTRHVNERIVQRLLLENHDDDNDGDGDDPSTCSDGTHRTGAMFPSCPAHLQEVDQSVNLNCQADLNHESKGGNGRVATNTKRRKVNARRSGSSANTSRLWNILGFVLLMVVIFILSWVHLQCASGGNVNTPSNQVNENRNEGFPERTVEAPTVAPDDASTAASASAVGSSAGNTMGNVTLVPSVILSKEQQYLIEQPPQQTQTQSQQRQKIIESVLAKQSFDAFTSSLSPHAQRAMEWLTNLDTSQLWDTLGSDSENNNDKIPDDLEATIVQRYVMTAFFFATHPEETPTTIVVQNGNNTGREADDKEKHQRRDRTRNTRGLQKISPQWMSPRHICEWHGIECSNDDDAHDNDDQESVQTSSSYQRIIRLEFSDTNLQGTFPQAEVYWLFHHEQILRLDLSNNQLEGPLEDTPSTSTSTSSCHLEFLLLQNNSLTGTIPSGWLGSSCQRAWQIDLSDNHLVGTLPTSVKHLSHLRRLNLSRNKLTGTLGALPNRLAELRLGHNHLSGSLPTEIGAMTFLETLELGSNNFSGTLASDMLQGLHRLVDVDLHNNSLCGVLPKLTSPTLQNIVLDHNQFTGSLPTSLATVTNLQALMVNSNCLNGTLPRELGELVLLQDLWLNHNSFSGSLPAEIAKLKRLARVLLHDNKLSGPFPAVFQEVQHLEYLKIQNNQLSGSISSEVCRLKHLANLHYVAADCRSRVACACCDKCY